MTRLGLAPACEPPTVQVGEFLDRDFARADAAPRVSAVVGDRLRATAGLVCSLFAAPAMAGEPIVGLIVKTESNTFFVTMVEATRERADELGVDLRSFAGRYDGDAETQIEAVETLTAADAAGILIAPSDPAALAGARGKARAAGVLVITLDTPFDPADTVDATFATDNFRAGELIGK